MQATNRASRTGGISGPMSSWALPYWGAMSRWLTPAARASWKEAAAVSGSEAEGGPTEDGHRRQVSGSSESALFHAVNLVRCPGGAAAPQDPAAASRAASQAWSMVPKCMGL